MPLLSKAALLEAVVAGLANSSWTVSLVSDDHPFDAIIANDSVALSTRICVWNVSGGGGGPEVRPANEARVQVTGVDLPLVVPDDWRLLLCGFDQEHGVIAAFDPERHVSPGSSASLQIPWTTLAEAAESGIAAHRKDNGEMAIALRPDMLPLYLLNQRTLHDMGTDVVTAEALNLAAAGEDVAAPEAAPAAVVQERSRVLSVVSRIVRDRRFRAHVLAAYDNTCAVCVSATQLGVVDAAHVIPAAAPMGSDHVTNGIAMCPLHHRAYDLALIGVTPDYSIIVNGERLEALIDAGFGGGVDAFLAGCCESLQLPDDPWLRPHPEFLVEGLVLRGWDV